MATKTRIAPGPWGEVVAKNVDLWRRVQNLTFADLSKRLQELGRPIAPLGLTRMRDLQRRIDVDDLMALSLALGVPPVVLLRPPSDHSSDSRDTLAITRGGPEYTLDQIFKWIGLRGLPTAIGPYPPAPMMGPIKLIVRTKRDGVPMDIDLTEQRGDLDIEFVQVADPPAVEDE